MVPTIAWSPFYAVVAGCRRRPVVAGGFSPVIGVANLFADRLLSSNAVTLLAMFAFGISRAWIARSHQRQRLHHPAAHASQGRSWRQPTLIRCRRSPRVCSCSSGRGGFPFRHY